MDLYLYLKQKATRSETEGFAWTVNKRLRRYLFRNRRSELFFLFCFL